MQRRNADGLVVNEAGEIMTNPVLRWSTALPVQSSFAGHVLLQVQTSEPHARPTAESFRLGKAPEHTCFLMTVGMARKMAEDLLRQAALIEKEATKPIEH